MRADREFLRVAIASTTRLYKTVHKTIRGGSIGDPELPHLVRGRDM